MEDTLRQLLDGMKQMQSDVAETKEVMVKMQEVQNAHSDAIIKLEGNGSGVALKEEKDDGGYGESR